MSKVHLIRNGRVAELRLDNPSKMNAFTVAMLDDLAAHLEDIESDAEIGAVMLTAEGDKAFCTGADINAWDDLNPTEFARFWVRAVP